MARRMLRRHRSAIRTRKGLGAVRVRATGREQTAFDEVAAEVLGVREDAAAKPDRAGGLDVVLHVVSEEALLRHDTEFRTERAENRGVRFREADVRGNEHAIEAVEERETVEREGP